MNVLSVVPAGADLGGGWGVGGCEMTEMTCGFLIQLVFCKKKTMWFIGVEVEQETSAPPPKKILDPPLSWVFSLAPSTVRVRSGKG